MKRIGTRAAVALLTLATAQPVAAQRTTDRFPEGPPQAVADHMLRPRDDAFAAIGRGMALGGLAGTLLARGVCAMQLRDTTACGRSMIGSALMGVAVGGFVWPLLEDRIERNRRRVRHPNREEDR